jgi:CheY-like chemotaxis protein
VDLRSHLDRGSTFSVDLPRAAPRPLADEPAVVMAPSPGRIAGLTVLCIDNEPAGRAGMQVLLEGWGCVAITAKSAADAIARLAQTGARADIILADYHLDDGTGVDAVAAVRLAAGSQLPVIVITADHSTEVQREVRMHGYGLLRKPLKAAALRALMYQLTWQRAVAAE